MRIPRQLLALYAIEEGDAIELEQVREGILIRTVSRQRLGVPAGTITSAEAVSLRHVITEMYGVLSVVPSGKETSP